MSPPTTGRVDRGRGHSYFLDGEPVPGVTTIIGKGIPKPALVDWAARTTAGYACDHWAELAEVGTAEKMQRLTRARWDKSTSAAVRGTAIHELAHRLHTGEEIDVPDPLVGHVDAYLAFIRDWRVNVDTELAEVAVFNRRWRYAGTLDLIAELGDGRRWLIDWKTSASGVFPEAALQLAAYANAETYMDAADTEHEMPELDAAAVVWLRADGYDLVPVNISEETFRTFLHAAVIARFSDAPRENYVREALAAPTWLEAASS